MKKRILTPYLLLAASLAIVIFLLFRAQGLQHQLTNTQIERNDLAKQVTDFHQLTSIDTLLVDGKYNSALKAYNHRLENKIGSDSIGLQLRIALAKDLMQFKAGEHLRNDTVSEARIDSLERIAMVKARGVRETDSLSFALEKAKVQLSSIKRQLQEKSLGEYLTFKSQKGSQMHYVGQVKNKKANGFGIALFSTGSRFEGQWRNNLRHGEGTFYWPDGEYYVGSYTLDKRNGEGTYYWPNGEKYVGQWKDDKRNGDGIFYGSDGAVVTSGVWKDDKLVEEHSE